MCVAGEGVRLRRGVALEAGSTSARRMQSHPPSEETAALSIGTDKHHVNGVFSAALGLARVCGGALEHDTAFRANAAHRRVLPLSQRTAEAIHGAQSAMQQGQVSRKGMLWQGELGWGAPAGRGACV